MIMSVKAISFDKTLLDIIVRRFFVHKGRRGQNKRKEILVINTLAVVAVIVMVVTIFTNPQIRENANLQGEKDNFSNKTETNGINNQQKGNGKNMSKKNNWELVLVNARNKISENYNASIMEVENGQYVDERCYSQLKAMISDCKNAGNSPVVCSSYRSHEKQILLFSNKIKELTGQGYSKKQAKKEAGKVIAVPGTSEHEIGLAVDIVDVNYQLLDDEQENTGTQQWLMKNCWKYGFILRYPQNKKDITGVIYEPWHYRYVGRKNAKKIMKQGLCLEEYLQMEKIIKKP